MVTKNAATEPTRRQIPRSGLGCSLLLVGAMGFLIAVAWFLSWCSIHGTEFCPNTFQARSFSYSRIPGTRILLSSTTLQNTRSIALPDVLKHLPTVNRPIAWHVASVSSSPQEQHAAGILIDAFEQRSADGSDFWGAWSFRNPSLAAILWPMVQSIAFQQLYDCLPEILEMAESARDAESLEKQALEMIARTVAERLKRASEESQSSELIDWLDGLSVTQPGNAEWFSELKKRVRTTRGPTEF